jgi:hypothetical protein
LGSKFRAIKGYCAETISKPLSAAVWHFMLMKDDTFKDAGFLQIAIQSLQNAKGAR